MKLLILTQKIDQRDDVLGFMHGWIAEFAKHCDTVIAVGLFVGEYDLPKNVRVYSLGKEHGVSRITYLWNFFRIILNERKNYDAVFVHMNQIYVLLGGLFWKLLGKKIALWYTHKQVSPSLRLAVLLTDHIFTASVESFRIRTPKCQVMGHGIAVAEYQTVEHIPSDTFWILSIGRISETKGYETLFSALDILKREGCKIQTEIVGAPITEEDRAYALLLKKRAEEMGLSADIVWYGAVPNDKIKPYLAKADLFVNMSRTGSLDKAVLEAMAARVPVLTSNVGLSSTLLPLREMCMFAGDDPADFAAHIRYFLAQERPLRQKLGVKLQEIVKKSHDREMLIPRIIELLQR